MTNIAIIGLGLMGASFAKKLTHLNYNVYGIDVSKQTIDKAKELNIIVDGTQENSCSDCFDKEVSR